ncbi:MAG: patatin family protein [Clostridiales bacterium]|nr:patatin family protein [Clostridiales bacterium]
MKTGLVLEGGAMRGMFTAGVLDVFMENHIPVNCVVGVSAGALFGVNYLSGQKGRVIRYNRRFNGDPNYMGIRPLLREGNIISTQYAYYDVPRHLDPFDDETYRKSEIPFYAVVTSEDTGKPEYMQVHSVFDQMDILRASASMPFVSKPVEIDGGRYLDGGVSDSIPFQWLARQGCDRLIVILTRDMEYRKKPMSKPLIQFFYHRYPEFAAQLVNRHRVYNRSVRTLARWEEKGRAFVVRPSRPVEIKRIESDPDKLQKVYDLGIRDGKDCLPKLREYLGKE